jgi:hypothetical protein
MGGREQNILLRADVQEKSKVRSQIVEVSPIAAVMLVSLLHFDF